MLLPFLQSVGPEHNLQIFGIRLLGVNAHNGHKLVLTAVVLLLIFLLNRALRVLAHATLGGRKSQTAFWTRQGISLLSFIFGLLVFVSVWFDNPARLATGIGLVGAGLAFALQKVITSFAGYFVILRGKTFNVGDRILMGGVRGDVVALNFMQTVILEMGQPPSAGDAADSSWVQSRQHTGRIVTVTNSNIFDTPVYNYSRDFPYIWEEIHLPLSYNADRQRAEAIMLEAAHVETAQLTELAAPALHRLQQHFRIEPGSTEPCVFYRITDNWLELTLRFISRDRDVRALKDRLSRRILADFGEAGIGIASSTYDIVGMPPLHVQIVGAPPHAPTLQPGESAVDLHA